MKITDVRTASLQANFEWILMRVTTDEGLVGLGEESAYRQLRHTGKVRVISAFAHLGQPLPVRD